MKTRPRTQVRGRFRFPWLSDHQCCRFGPQPSWAAICAVLGVDAPQGGLHRSPGEMWCIEVECFPYQAQRV